MMPRFAAVAGLVVIWSTAALFAHPDDPKLRDHQPPYVGPSYRQAIDGPLENGPMRGPGLFNASGVELKSWITLSDLQTLTGEAQQNGNDCWGYTSPSGREYAIIGLYGGTAFVEVTDPTNAQYIGYIDGPNSLWRDIKTYQHYAYAVSEGGGGIQVIDLGNIDAATNRVSLVTSITDGGTAASHNVIINEQSGYLYRCGGGDNGLRMYSLANPASPAYVGLWSDRYVHDCQVVNYSSGPFAGREIAICCSGFNGGGTQTGLDFLDVTDKQNIINLYPARIFWPNAGYSHQLWLSPDRNYAYVNDELDEGNSVVNTRTLVVDTRFLSDANFTAPALVSAFDAPSTAIGHNLYTLGDLIFEANYRSGLRIFCAENQTAPSEIAFFDTYPDDDAANFNGAWSNYPYFPSGTVIVSDLERGLFVLDVSGATQTLLLGHPDPLPEFISPNGDTTIRATVRPAQCGDGEIAAGSVTLHYDVGGGYVSVPMTPIGGDTYEGQIGPSDCGEIVAYFITAMNGQGTTFNLPASGAADPSTGVSAFGETLAVSYDFETDPGWTTSVSGATAGGWQRGVPVNDPGWDYDPASDGDGSGQCWLTQNTTGNSDVDGGSVRLTTTTYDLSSGTGRISYLYFLKLTTVSAGDGLFVDVSNSGTGGPWTRIRNFTSDGGLTWHADQIESTEITALGVTLTANMALRFTAADINPGAIVEAGIDGFTISTLDCAAPCAGADGDLNVDGLVDGQDVSAFTAAVIGSPTAGDICHGDFSTDSALTVDDVPGMVAALLVP